MIKEPKRHYNAPICIYCDKPVNPGEPWEACRRKGGGVIYAHQKCIKRREPKK